MSTYSRIVVRVAAVALATAVAACSEPTASSLVPTGPQLSAVKFWEAGSSVAWNKTARDLIAARGGGTPLTQTRILTYLSVAQYNAIIAAEDAKDRGDHPSPAAAAAGASLVVLKSFFPLDGALLDQTLANQKAEAQWPGEQTKDVAAGEAVGRAVGAAVVAYAATDRTNLTPPPANPGGAGKWTGTNSAVALYGARTFALESGDQFRPGPPPAFGSPEFNAALQEIRALSDGLTAAQLAIAQFWNPNGPAYLNGVASEMIVAHHKSEREAARVFALANMAGFDVLNACFDAKFAYWYIRPSQADPSITLATGLPNHPSYPSAHSCETGAFEGVLADAFPSERAALSAVAEEASMSRVIGGIHYRFDGDAGLALGRAAARLALQRRGLE